MSLILDALRKSERARQQTLTGQVSSVAPASEHHRLPTPWLTLFGVILLLNAAVLAVLLWRADHNPHGGDTRTAVLPAATVAVSRPVIRPLAEEVTQTATHDADNPVAAQTAQAAVTAAASSTPAPASAQLAPLSAAPLDTLPLAFQQSLPTLHLDVHSYAPDPADRFVVINMQRYTVGDTLKEGPRVLAITQQGVILEYQGTRFMIPRN